MGTKVNILIPRIYFSSVHVAFCRQGQDSADACGGTTQKKKKNLIQVCGGRLHLGTWKRKIRYAAVDSISAHSSADDNLSGLCCSL